RLFWLCVRRWWPQWKDALMLVRPATVGRWHREGFGGCWRRRARRQPGRPRIDSERRAIIRRLSAENGSLGRSANPRRVAEARLHGLRTDGLAIFAEPTENPGADLPHIPREPPRRLDVQLDRGLT